MLDGDRYFASFPDETANDRPARARPLTPELLAALAELDRELRTFLEGTREEDASNEASDERHA